jgi:hypothetical protein
VRQVASGHTNGEAVAELCRSVANAVLPFSRRAPRYAAVGTDGLYGGAHIFAADVTVQSLGKTNKGGPTGDSELGPLFFLEVESEDRSLLSLIRHLGMLHQGGRKAWQPDPSAYSDLVAY